MVIVYQCQTSHPAEQPLWNNARLTEDAMNRTRLDTLIHTLCWLTAVAVGAMTIRTLWLSRYAPIEWDLAMLHYCAYLINEKGFILYKDIFENNLPGVFLFHSLLGKLVGYDAASLRLADFCILGTLAYFTARIIIPFTRPGACLAICLFIAMYLYGGSYYLMQRDYIGIVPIAAAFCVLLTPTYRHKTKLGLIGALCGLSCSFKPNFIIAVPAFFYLLHTHSPSNGLATLLKQLLTMGAAFVAVFFIPVIWGYYHGDYHAFIDIYKTFTPIYVESRPDMYHYASRQEHLYDLLKRQGELMLQVFIFSIPGWLWAKQQCKNHPQNADKLMQIGIMTMVFSFYELMAGKYWFSHKFPSYYWGIVCFSLLFTALEKTPSIAQRITQCIAFISLAWLALFAAHATMNRMNDFGYTATNDHIRSKQIAAYLTNHLKPGDTVQGIDGSGDGQGALLLVQATVATRFLEDIPLYMQPTNPATQKIRQEFMSDLSRKPPKFIVYIHNMFHPGGGNRLKEFTALYNFINNQYEIAENMNDEYTIYRLKQPIH